MMNDDSFPPTPLEKAGRAAFEYHARYSRDISLSWDDLHEESQNLWINLAGAVRKSLES